MNTLDTTVIRLFESLERMGLRYALLRNSENFPVFGHDIDLVMHHADLPAFERLLSDLAAEQGWSALVRCDHWNRSATPHHTIEIFRLFQLDSPAYLQIDVFHGYCLWGLPLCDEQALLETRERDPRGFVRIDPSQENFFRLLQLHRLYRWQSHLSDKIQRYRQAVLEYIRSDHERFAAFATAYIPQFETVITALQMEQSEEFCRLIHRFKRDYFLVQVCRRPARTFRLFYERLLDYVHNYWLNPCGCVIRAFSPEAELKPLLPEVLDALRKKNLVTNWATITSPWELWRWQPRKVLERGGIVIQWVKHQAQADVVISVDRQTIQTRLIQCLIANHPGIAPGHTHAAGKAAL